MPDGAQYPRLELAQREAMRSLVKTLCRQLGESYASIGRAAGVDAKWVHSFATQRNRTGKRGDLAQEDEARLQSLYRYAAGLEGASLTPDAAAFRKIVLNEHRGERQEQPGSSHSVDEHAHYLAHTLLRVSKDEACHCAERLFGKYLLHRYSYPDQYATTSWLEISKWSPEHRLPTYTRYHLTTRGAQNKHDGFIIPKSQLLFFLGITNKCDIHLMIAFDPLVYDPPFLQGILLSPALGHQHRPFAAKVHCERLPDDAQRSAYQDILRARKLEEAQRDIADIEPCIDNRTDACSVLKFTDDQLNLRWERERKGSSHELAP